MIKIFSRKAWKPDPSYPYGFAPYAGARKTHIDFVDTIDEAVERCEAHNKKRPEFGTKGYFKFSYYEFTENF